MFDSIFCLLIKVDIILSKSFVHLNSAIMYFIVIFSGPNSENVGFLFLF